MKKIDLRTASGGAAGEALSPKKAKTNGLFSAGVSVASSIVSGRTLTPKSAIAGKKTIRPVFLSVLMITVMGISSCKRINPDAVTPNGETKTAKQTNSATGSDFIIAVIPDTQIYVETNHNENGNHWLDYFKAQTQWIADNKTDQNIAYVIHVGDIVNDGDQYVSPWLRADTAMDILDAANVPYGTAVGNHEQTPNGKPYSGSVNDGSTTVKYNQYFGVSRVGSKSWYGGTYLAGNNDSHYDYFTAGGMDFIVIYLEYDDTLMDNSNMVAWASTILTNNSSRKAILVTHHVGSQTTPSTFGPQAAAIYSSLKSHANLFMFVGGHVPGEGYRQDTYNGKTIKSFISDYQFRDFGGEGYMRIMKISPSNDLITVQTYSPYRENHSQSPYFETDSDSEFTKSLFHSETATRTCDFNKNGTTELSFYNAGVWKVNGMSNYSYGQSTDIPVPMDYNGDGKTDYCLFRPSTQMWYSSSTADHGFGQAGDIPVPGDYNGDGLAEFAVYRPSTGNWYMYPSGSAYYGSPGDIPVPGDYDGDGKVDEAIWRSSDSTWHLNHVLVTTYGGKKYIPVPGDYNGDGKVDIAMFNPSNGKWYLRNISESIIAVTPATGDIPVPGDYDGDGKTQPAVYRPSNHTLYMYHWNSGTITSISYGAAASGDKALNLPYHIRKFFFP